MEVPPTVSVVASAVDGPTEIINRALVGERAFNEDVGEYRSNRALRSGHGWSINAHGLSEEIRNPPPSQSGDQTGIRASFMQVQENDDRLIAHLLKIYRIGVVEWVNQYQTPGIPSSSFADDVHDVLRYVARIFNEAGYVGRLLIWVRVEHAESEVLILSGFDASSRQPGVESLEHVQEVSLDQLAVDPTPVVREAMDAIWQGFGLSRCLLFDNDGHWQAR